MDTPLKKETNTYFSVYSPDYKLTMDWKTGHLDNQGQAKITFGVIDNKGTLHTATALIDTGANISVLSDTFFKTVATHKSKRENITIESLIGEKSNKEIYDGIYLYMEDKMNSRPLEFVVHSIAHIGIDIILGTEFLKTYCGFTYNVELAAFTFCLK